MVGGCCPTAGISGGRPHRTKPLTATGGAPLLGLRSPLASLHRIRVLRDLGGPPGQVTQLAWVRGLGGRGTRPQRVGPMEHSLLHCGWVQGEAGTF